MKTSKAAFCPKQNLIKRSHDGNPFELIREIIELFNWALLDGESSANLPRQLKRHRKGFKDKAGALFASFAILADLFDLLDCPDSLGFQVSTEGGFMRHFTVELHMANFSFELRRRCRSIFWQGPGKALQKKFTLMQLDGIQWIQCAHTICPRTLQSDNRLDHR